MTSLFSSLTKIMEFVAVKLLVDTPTCGLLFTWWPSPFSDNRILAWQSTNNYNIYHVLNRNVFNQCEAVKLESKKSSTSYTHLLT